MRASHIDSIEETADLMLNVFGRSSPSAKLCDNGNGPRTVHAPITREDMIRHLRGTTRLGAIPYLDEQSVRWVCFDLDALNWGSAPDAL